MENIIKQYTNESIELLEKLISIPSVSRSETAVADLLEQQMKDWGLEPKRYKNNLVLTSQRPPMTPPQGGGQIRSTILLNAHIDTVKPSDSWTKEPFQPTWEGDRLYGLGSNDCGGGLVSLLAAYRILTLPLMGSSVLPLVGELEGVSLIFVASAEEEVSGKDGFEYVRQFLPKIDVAIVGEPTGMQPAIAEKGLMVLDFTAQGKAGHAAREEGINALYRAMDVISMLRDFKFESVSPFLGPVKMTVTMVHAGTQHNVIPDTCTFTADVRSNEMYSNRQIFDLIQENLPEWCLVRARSFNLNSSRLNPGHPIVRKAVSLGLEPYGSPTLSDQAVLACPSFKMGPGDSARSHTAGEYICLSELEAAVPAYLKLLDGLEIG